MPSLRLLLCCLALLAAGAAPAQNGPAADASAAIGQVETDLRAVDRTLDAQVESDARKALRAKAVAAQAAARGAIGQLQEQMALIDARIAELGPVPDGVPEARELRTQRATLAAQRATLDAAVRRGRLAEVEGGQLVDEIDRSQAEQFSQTLSTRVASPVTPAFWSALLTSLPRDARRISLFLTQGSAQIEGQWRGGWPWPALLGAGLAVLLLGPARLLARRAGQFYLIEGAPGHRLRRSVNGLLRVAVGTLAPLLAAVAAVQGLRWAGLLPLRWSGLLDAVIVAGGFAGFSAAITQTVLMRSQPSWRIAPIGDEAAARLHPLTWALAAIAAASILLTAFNAAIGASRAAQVAAEAIEALVHLMLIVALLVTLGRLRARRAEQPSDPAAPGAGLGAITLLLWVAVAAALVALLLGYIAFGLFVGQFVTWALVLGCTFYLLGTAADDVATTVFTRRSRVGQGLMRTLGVRGSLIDQFGLLLSIVLRLALVLLGLGLLLSPFGTGGGIGSLFGRLGVLAQGVSIGGIAISPGAILRGIAVLFIGLALVRGFMGWLERRYLPATDLDGSGRNSVSLIARYVGIALAGIWALASLGIGVERIALLLSALSVGIGFGLQAITQNFVSGLILLAERPIKIGDLVRVGTDEGDVKRISVRSTEIELADHSTLIVPNSELITKSVLNKTLAGPLGRMQIQFSVPIEADVAAVRAIVADAFAAEPSVLADPAPSVFIDGIADGRVLFNCFAHVASPRVAYGARSAVLTAILIALHQADIAIGTVPQRLELVGSPPASPTSPQ